MTCIGSQRSFHEACFLGNLGSIHSPPPCINEFEHTSILSLSLSLFIIALASLRITGQSFCETPSNSDQSEASTSLNLSNIFWAGRNIRENMLCPAWCVKSGNTLHQSFFCCYDRILKSCFGQEGYSPYDG